MTKRYWNIDLEKIMRAGVHFGHGTRKWNPRMAPYISTKHKEGFNRLLKRDAAVLKRQLSRMETYLGGIKYMTGLPDIVIILDQQEE
ncbi:unnamed protein product [Arabidopsis thaliana]|uniref:Small ribosomal subunit protein uS2c n=1 Tax=Arabidopsis thaliana TaxID=3702 RepID=Q9LHB6_ARATH|nr:unnamed protein product [Arabidopsis thaliana]